MTTTIYEYKSEMMNEINRLEELARSLRNNFSRNDWVGDIVVSAHQAAATYELAAATLKATIYNTRNA